MIGRTFAHYRVVERLGAGGMGEVYRARDEHLDRDVALKVLPPGTLDDEDARRRFHGEAKALSRLNHPHIATVHDFDRADGVDFLVMEYVPGQTLSELIGRTPLAEREILGYAGDIATALEEAHGHGVVHRDLKPANVIVTPKGHAKVLDFGVAQLSSTPAEIDETLTRPANELAGTPAYMAPEQLRGEASDGRTDIYALGVVLYEMATGKRPFDDEHTGRLADAVLHAPVTPPTQMRPGLSPEFERIVLKCLERDPDNRYQSAREVAIDLRRLASPTSQGAPTTGARRRSRWAIALAAGVVVIAGAAWATFFRGRDSTPSRTLEAVPLTSDVGDEESPSFSPDGNHVAYSWSGERQDNEDIYVKLIDAPKPLRLTTDPARDVRPAFSPDGRSIGFVRVAKDRWTYMVASAAGGSERMVAELPQDIGNPITPFGATWSSTWLPDGKAVVIDGLQELSLETGLRRYLTDRQGQRLVGWYPAMSPDGRTLAFARPSGMAATGLYLLDRSSDGQFRGDVLTVSEIDGDLLGLTWTPDSRALVYSGGRLSGSSGVGKSLWRVAAKPGARPEPLLVGDDATSPTVARTGDRLAFVRNTLDANLWRALLPGSPGLQPAASRFASSTRSEWNPQYSPDGRRVAFESMRTGESAVFVADADGSNPEPIFSHPGKHSGTPRWSPDSRRIAFDSSAAGNFDVYMIEVGNARPRRLTEDAADDAMPSWSPDGQWIYFSSDRTGRQEVWRAPAAGGPAEQITRNGGACVYPSADGARIYYTKHDGDAALWTRAVDSGGEEQALPSVMNRAFVVVGDGIYFVPQKNPDGSFGVHYLDFATGRVYQVTPLNGPPNLGLTVSPDRKYVLYAESDQAGSDLMLVNGFR